MINKDDGDRNAFIYACENNRLEMLAMMINLSRISSEQKYNYTFKSRNGMNYTIKGGTGFVIACFSNNLEVVALLIDKYPYIV